MPPVMDTAQPGLDPKTRSSVLLVHPGRMARECPAMRTVQLGPDTPFHRIVHIMPQGPDGDVSGSIFTNIPGDELAMSIGYREMVTKTLDELCMSPGNSLSELMMCGLDCPWLSPFLLVSLGDCWAPGEIRVLTNFPPGMCFGSVSRFPIEIGHELDLSLVRTS